MNRIFISYRSADGAKDASRLAEDLGRVFGADNVFLDRQDLRGGSSWRHEIEQAIGHRPIVLLLVTPGFVGACHPDGRLRLDDPDDPVRMEIQSAIAAGAVLLPLRVDGTPMPAALSLPEPLRAITEHHALPLRTDDWVRVDVPRVIADIERHGVPRIDAPVATRGVAGLRGWIGGGAVVLALVLMVRFLADDHSGANPSPIASIDAVVTAIGPVARNAVAPSGASLDGAWMLTTGDGERIPLYIRHRDDRLELRSEPVRIDDDPDWKAYIDSVATIKGPRLTHIRFSAEGEVFGDEADLAVVVASADGSYLVDSGNLHLRIAPDRSVLTGQVSLNSGEQETVALRRRP